MSNKKKDSELAVKKMSKDEPRSVALADTFSGPANLEHLLKTAKRRNLPVLIKPKDVPVGGIVHGWIEKIIQSMSPTVKGKLIWLRQGDKEARPGDPEYLFPLTGTVRQALIGPVSRDDEKAASAAIDAGSGKEIGKYLIMQRKDDGESKRFPGKPMYQFDVFTCDDPSQVP
jgi:hypothetical protein